MSNSTESQGNSHNTKGWLLVELSDDLTRFETTANGHRRFLPPTTEKLYDYFSDYPSLRQVGPPDEIGSGRPGAFDDADSTWSVHVGWELGYTVGLWSADWSDAVIDVKLERTRGKVLPRVGDSDGPRHPLVAWWCVLYAASMLTRYHPVEWARMLDADDSRWAVALSQMLRAAADEIPWAVFNALRCLERDRDTSDG